MHRFIRKSGDSTARHLDFDCEFVNDGSPVSELLSKAVEHQRERRFKLADELLDQVFELEPDNFQAHFIRGTMRITHQKFQEAIDLLNRAIDLNPKFYEAWTAYGVALTGLNQYEDAILALNRAIDENPTYPESHFSLARLHKKLGEWDNAIMHFRRALQYDPAHANAHNELAECYYAKGEYDESMSCCHSALLIDKRFPAAHNNLGRALAALGQTKSAEDSFRTAIRFDPIFAEAYCNLGKTFLNLGRAAQALEVCIQATNLNPNLALGWSTRGEALRRLGRLDEALKSCEKALAADPNSFDALNGLGLVLLDSGIPNQAVNAFWKATEVNYSYSNALSNLVVASRYATSDENFSDRKVAEEWAKRFGYSDLKKEPLNGPVYRIGFLTGPLQDTSTGQMLEAILSGFKQQPAEILVYANDASEGPQAERISKACSRFRRIVGLDDRTAATIIREDGVDALIDMSGHGIGGRPGVLVNNAAPIQVAWFGCNGTTGLPQTDWILGDQILLQQDESEAYTEGILKLERCAFAFKEPEFQVDLAQPPHTYGLPFTFGAFHPTKKITQPVVETWAEILNRVPESRILIKSPNLASQAVRDQITEWFKAFNISEDRLIYRQATSRRSHFASYEQVDLALDTFPASGCTSTFEALWCGVPVLTWPQAGYSGRLTQTILDRVGLQDFVADSRETYVQLAVDTAEGKMPLDTLRTDLRNRLALSDLCDTVGLAKAVHAALKTASSV
ncbi:tetratricopeptide repeat protein [Kamptonema cortianum]|nr:tetratricopeptide repeat protein [Geitlerinema splendidum]MDK3157705.1 tetratricopeptide repeat protein [Kamptonema cortianum]